MSRVYGRAFEQSKEMRKVSDCKGRRIKPEMVRLFNEGKTYKEIGEIVGLGSEYIKKIINSKDRKISNTKSQRARPIIIEMLNELEAIKDIASSVGLNVTTIRKVMREENVNLKTYNNKVIIKKRDKLILMDIMDGLYYKDIGKKFGISERQVNTISIRNGLRRTKRRKDESLEVIPKIHEDFDNGMSWTDLREKYDLTYYRMAYLREYGLRPIYTESIQKRADVITEEYKCKLAKEVLNSNVPGIDNPEKIMTKGTIYTISSNNGFKKYPKIGDRYKGGLFVEKKVISIIKRLKKKKKTGLVISDYLNKKGFKSPMGNPYNQHMVAFKWAKIKKLKL